MKSFFLLPVEIFFFLPTHLSQNKGKNFPPCCLIGSLTFGLLHLTTVWPQWFAFFTPSNISALLTRGSGTSKKSPCGSDVTSFSWHLSKENAREAWTVSLWTNRKQNVSYGESRLRRSWWVMADALLTELTETVGMHTSSNINRASLEGGGACVAG